MSLTDKLKKNIRNAVLGLGLVGILASCNETINPPPGPGPNPGINDSCVTGTAINYASQIGLPLDVKVLDNNNDVMGGCFTNHEQSWLNELKAIQNEGVLTNNQLQETVNQFETVGPMLPVALRLSYQGFKEDRQYEPDVVTWSPKNLGWVPLDKILPDASLPAMRHDWLGEPLTNYPINRLTANFGPPDWKNLDPNESSSFLSEFGACDLCYATQNVLNTGSIDMSLDIPFDEVGNPLLIGYPVHAGNLTPGIVDNITIYTRGMPGNEFSVADVLISYDIHPDDKSLMNVENVSYSYAHVAPNMERYFDATDFPFAVGDEIEFNEQIGYINERFGTLLDFTLGTHDDIGIGPYMPIDLGGGEILKSYTIDVLGSKYYPEGLRATPTQPRYRDNRILSPYPVEYVLMPVPDEP